VIVTTPILHHADLRRWLEPALLYLPSFPEKEIEALRGTIEYPPRGSAKRDE